MTSGFVIVRLVAAHLAALACGLNLLALVIRGARSWPAALRLGVAYPLGTTAITLMLFMLNWLSLRLSTLNVATATVLLLVASVAACSLARAPNLSGDTRGEREPLDLWSIILLVLLGVHLLSMSLVPLRNLFIAHDVLWYWGFLARAFAYSGATDFPPQVTFAYPMHVPLGQAYLYLAIGQINLVLGKTFFVAQLWALAACVYGAQRVAGVTRAWSLFFTVAAVACPLTVVRAAGLDMADLTESVGVLILFAGTALFFDKQEWDFLRLAGIGGIIAVWTKPEGAVWLALAGAVAVVLCWRTFGKKQAAVAAATVGAAPFVIWLALAAFARSRGLPTAAEFLTFQLHRLPSAVVIVLSSLVNPWDWGCIWYHWLAAIVVGGGMLLRGRRGVLNSLIIGGLLITIGLHATTGVNPGVGPDKRFTQLLPAVALLLGWTWPALLSSKRETARPD